jgi:drug/metabolite transporter (DMT)-like permease
MDMALLVGIGVFDGLRQILVTFAYRDAKVFIVAALDYTSLIWAMIIGAVVFHDLPHTSVYLGSLLVVGSGFSVLLLEHRGARQAALSGDMRQARPEVK